MTRDGKDGVCLKEGSAATITKRRLFFNGGLALNKSQTAVQPAAKTNAQEQTVNPPPGFQFEE